MKPFLDWSSYQNAGLGDAYADIPKQGGHFAKAVAVCIGSRQCEQAEHKGVMCPSFKVTKNPAFSPGGRVKLLKAMLNGEAVDEDALHEAMSLCVACKGCKRECENEVDMASLKAEFLAQQHSRHGVSIRHRLWAETPRLLRIPGIRHAVKWRNRTPWLARMLDRTLGISARAKLPVPAAKPFKDACRASDASERSVLLFVDTFTRYFQPEAAEAAQSLLDRAGYRVLMLTDSKRPYCCGRSYFSQGFIEQARNEAQRLLDALRPHLEADRPIVGLEPSCILSLRDEYLKLGLGEQARQLADKALLLEEFIVREQAAKRWRLSFQSVPDLPRLLVHGHCHQKAVGASKSVRKILKQIPGLDFELIDTSCCGMAGHFGLESEHFDNARAMAELALLPALRAEPETPVLNNGFSCRQPIAEVAKQSLHLAELLLSASVETSFDSKR